jgi:hypothetical protein
MKMNKDDLTLISQKVKDIFSKNKIPATLRRLRSIHGSHDDIMDFDINTSKNIQVLPDDDNPGKYLLIGMQYLIETNEVPKKVWSELPELGIRLKR